MKLIGLTGQTGSGKDTVADFLRETQGFVQIAFADPLVNPDIWVTLAAREVERLRNAPDYLHISGIVISDVRLENEAAWIRRQGGEIWHIMRGEIYSMFAEEYRASR